jgi:thymidylate kinase
MASVALIGPDGAGKTTLTRMLMQSQLVPFKYLYMGIDIPRSNVALPTSRLVERMKARSPGAQRHSSLGGVLRLVHRLGDEWFRQAVSWLYQVRGYTVLYDRHFALDFAPEIVTVGTEVLPWHKRMHMWCLSKLYPLPDVVIFLDAPGELLFARKGELTIAELERRRQGFLALGRRIPGFVRIDATRPLPEVYADVERLAGRR